MNGSEVRPGRPATELSSRQRWVRLRQREHLEDLQALLSGPGASNEAQEEAILCLLESAARATQALRYEHVDRPGLLEALAAARAAVHCVSYDLAGTLGDGRSGAGV